MIDPVYSSAASDPTSDGMDIKAILERIERWDDPYARGPGLYFVVERESPAEFAAPMGTNRWPVENCATVFAEISTFLETAQNVALSRDGAVVVHSDGTIEEAMVRVDQLSTDEYRRTGDLPYAG